MGYALYLDLKIHAKDHDLAVYKEWLPTQPHGTPVKLQSYPINIPAWKVRAKVLGFNINITLSLSGEIGIYADGNSLSVSKELTTSGHG